MKDRSLRIGLLLKERNLSLCVNGLFEKFLYSFHDNNISYNYKGGFLQKFKSNQCKKSYLQHYC